MPYCLLIYLKVNFNNVNLTVIKPWIAKRITELMGVEDEVMIEYAFGLLETDVIVLIMILYTYINGLIGC